MRGFFIADPDGRLGAKARREGRGWQSGDTAKTPCPGSRAGAKSTRRLDEDAKARQYDIGVQLKSEDETLQDTMETGLVAYGAPGSYDRQLSDEERKELEKQLERYDSRVMTDRDAANVAAVLITAAGAAAALVPQDTTDRDSGQSAPAVLMEPRGTEDEAEVILDGAG